MRVISIKNKEFLQEESKTYFENTVLMAQKFRLINTKFYLNRLLTDF
jgi:hypothetical protein